MLSNREILVDKMVVIVDYDLVLETDPMADAVALDVEVVT